jgi:uncharacterized protein YndB with AHSA1/START domain
MAANPNAATARKTEGKTVATSIDPAIPPELREAVITRTFDAPRALVWQAWTEPQHIAKWWGPRGFGAAHPTVDLRVDGKMNFDMRTPDGTIIPAMATIREIKPPERLVISMVARFGTELTEMLNEIVLAEDKGKTRLTLRVTVVRATAAMIPGLQGMRVGWNQSFDKMAEHLDAILRAKPASSSDPGKRLGDLADASAPQWERAAHTGKTPMTPRSVTHATFTVERTFEAAPATVFNAFADEKAKDRWFVGPPGWTITEKSMDFRVGGSEVNNGGPPGGQVHKFYAHYYDIVPNARIVYAYEMYLDDARISVSVASIEFKPAGKGTRLVLTEQGAFLDSFDNPKLREEGTRYLVEALARSLGEKSAAA